MPDIFETMWAMGVPSSDMTDLTEVAPFRVSTVGERLMQRKAMEDYFDIAESGFVENTWGFPFIPLPQRRSSSTEGLTIAPESVSFEGLGHPIFWVDPSLTRRTDEERAHPERWSIRMFYLLMALGMFDPDTLKWHNVPRSQGIDYLNDDWIAYRQGTSSALDMVRPLDESDLLEPVSSVLAMTRKAFVKCGEVQSAVWARYRSEVSAAYMTAMNSAEGRSEWDSLDVRISETTQKIAQAVTENIVPTSLIPDVYAQVDELERVVKHAERCALILSIPVLGSDSHGDRAASAATAILAAEADVDIDANTLRVEAHRLFSLSNNSKSEDFARLHQTANAIYMKSHRAMMLAARNLVRAADGDEIYQSWEAFELVEDVNSAQWPQLSQVLAGISR